MAKIKGFDSTVPTEELAIPWKAIQYSTTAPDAGSGLILSMGKSAC